VFRVVYGAIPPIILAAQIARYLQKLSSLKTFESTKLAMSFFPQLVLRYPLLLATVE
jgi:hypothetical protein